MDQLLPNNIDNLIQQAIQHFWKSRESSKVTSQDGGRGTVIGGKNMDGFTKIIKEVVEYCGIPSGSLISTGKKKLTIPGYFRPTKIWDSLLIYKGRLIAAFELKSQVGSFGNNFNNRTEESLGSAKDFWTAYREKAFELSNYRDKLILENLLNKDNKPPYLSYLMLLEKCDASISPVKVEEEHFGVFKEFKKSSYADRYKILCEKLMLEGLYSSASLILSERDKGYSNGEYETPNDTLSPRAMFAEFASRLLAAKEIYK